MALPLNVTLAPVWVMMLSLVSKELLPILLIKPISLISFGKKQLKGGMKFIPPVAYTVLPEVPARS